MKRVFISILLIALLTAFAAYVWVWWTIAIVAFIVTLIMGLKPASGFWAGFWGIAAFWLITILWQDIPNDHILSARMATLFHLPGYVLLILVNVIIGALVGGLAGWAGSLARKMFKMS